MARRIKLKKPIYNRTSFLDKQEVQYYKMYKKMKLQREMIYDTHTAVGICEGYIPARTTEEELGAWQYLIDTGVCWHLQGWFGRTAKGLIESGMCKEKTIN